MAVDEVVRGTFRATEIRCRNGSDDDAVASVGRS
jgi:hypothetical protein